MDLRNKILGAVLQISRVGSEGEGRTLLRVEGSGSRNTPPAERVRPSPHHLLIPRSLGDY